MAAKKESKDWQIVRSVCQVQFDPSQNDHSGLLQAVSHLSQSYKHTQQSQLQTQVPVQTPQGVVLQNGTLPQWILRKEEGSQQVALHPQALTLENAMPGSSIQSLVQEAEALWRTCLTFLLPTKVTRIGVRTVISAPNATNIQSVLKQSPFFAPCILDNEGPQASRVEFTRDKIAFVVSVGPNKEGTLLVDIDVINTEGCSSDWKDIHTQVSALHKASALILKESIPDFASLGIFD